MIRLPCSKCGSTDHPKYRRMKIRRSGKKTPSMASYCILCHSEDQKIREERRYEKKLAYNREWCKRNREKKNFSARKTYAKRKGIAFNPMALVDWHGTVNDQGFSTMTYVSLYPGPPWGDGRKVQ